MPISKYPRKGHPLAPKALAPILNDSLFLHSNRSQKSAAITIDELNETAWKRFSKHECLRLADSVIEKIREVWNDIPIEVFRQTLPALPPGTAIQDLELETRTYTRLRKLQIDQIIIDASDLAKLNIGQICELPSFGGKSLVDLLTSLEAFARIGPVNSRPDTLDVRAPKAREILDSLDLSESTSVSQLFSGIGCLRLPRIPNTLRLSDLQLSVRAFRCMRKHFGLRRRLSRLNRWTISDLLEIPGFGPQSLIDFLHGLQYALRNQSSWKGERKEKLSHSEESELSSLEEELCQLTIIMPKRGVNETSSRNGSIATELFGFDGHGGATLQAVAEKYKITRERVRQICLRVRNSIQRRNPTTPKLDRAIAIINEAVPVAAHEIERRLQEKGLSKICFKIEGIVTVCELLGRRIAFELVLANGQQVLMRKAEGRHLDTVTRYASGAVRMYGAVTIADVFAQLQKKLGSSATEQFVRQILALHPDFEWLDFDGGWFWFKSRTKNRVQNRIRKILSVSKILDVNELRTGVARHHKMKGYAPPRRVLLEMCRRMPGVTVDGTAICTNGELDWRTMLLGTERIMAQILNEHGAVLSRAQFETFCCEVGMKKGTFYAYLNYSPVIERFAAGVFGLRGASPPPGLVESLSTTRGKTTVRLDHGWTTDRRIWVAYRISDSVLANGIVSVPGGFREMLQGEFDLRSSDRKPVGRLVVRDYQAWGLGPFFRRRGGDVEDVLLLIFELDNRIVTATIGSEELLDSLHDDDPAQQCAE